MAHTDKQVQDMAAGTGKCADLMKKAQDECKTAKSTYTAACKKEMMAAVEASAMPFSLLEAPSSAKEAETAASDSSAALKKAEDTLTKETASPDLKAAIVKCDIKKNVAKRTCIAAVHGARNSCVKMTSTSVDDRNTNL